MDLEITLVELDQFVFEHVMFENRGVIWFDDNQCFCCNIHNYYNEKINKESQRKRLYYINKIVKH